LEGARETGAEAGETLEYALDAIELALAKTATG
jgi:hypothetical protein